MRANVFLDTNILVYAIESGGPARAKTAVAQALVRRSDVCLSTQVLGEFYRAVTSLVRKTADLEDVYRALQIMDAATESSRQGRRVELPQ